LLLIKYRATSWNGICPRATGDLWVITTDNLLAIIFGAEITVIAGVIVLAAINRIASVISTILTVIANGVVGGVLTIIINIAAVVGTANPIITKSIIGIILTTVHRITSVIGTVNSVITNKLCSLLTPSNRIAGLGAVANIIVIADGRCTGGADFCLTGLTPVTNSIVIARVIIGKRCAGGADPGLTGIHPVANIAVITGIIIG
jgi:hypothetical protein